MTNPNIQTEVAQHLDSITDDSGDCHVGHYRLVTHHNNEMLDCRAINVPSGSKLDIVIRDSGKVVATFDLEHLTLSQLTAYLNTYKDSDHANQAVQSDDIDNLPLDGLTEVTQPSRDTISLTIQRDNYQTTRHFEGERYQKLYLHALRDPKVRLCELGIRGDGPRNAIVKP